ncbi:MAG: glycosyltransferase family 39 protein [Anaerolineae bacterium]
MSSVRRRFLGWAVDTFVLALALTAFLLLTTHQIALPGLHTDEALEVIPAVQLLRGEEVECYKDVCIDLFGLRLPVMIYEYIATVNTYMAIPFFALFGISVPTLRAMPIAQSAVAMIFLYLLARELYNRRVAALSVLLLAVSPSYVFWSRQGVFVTSVTIPIALIGVWASVRWWRSQRSGYLYLAAFTFGLGISAKFLFGWLLAGAVAAFLLLNLDRIVASLWRRSWSPLGIRLSWRQVVFGSLLFVIGLAPLIVFNIRTMSTIHYIRDNVFGTSYYEVDNANIGENLRERIKELRSVLNGETFWYLSIDPYASWRYPSVFLIAVGVTVYALFGRARETLRETLPNWATVAATVTGGYLAIRLLPTGTSSWYLAPGAAGAIAGTAVGMVRLYRDRPWAILRRAGVGLIAGAVFTVFAYLAWKMAAWAPHARTYAVAVVCLALAPGLRANGERRRLLFPVLIVAGMLVLSVFSPTALWFTHLAILTPWPPLIIAVAADAVARRAGLDRLQLGRLPAFGGRTWARTFSLGTLVAVALAGMLIYDDLEVDLAYHRDLARIGGKGDHTQASYRLVAYLQANGITDVIAMDYGIQDVVQFLTAGEINPPEIFGYDDRERPDSAYAIRVREYLHDPEAAYVFRVQPLFQQRWEAFQEIAQQAGKQVVEETVIYDWSARPIYRVVRAVPRS